MKKLNRFLIIIGIIIVLLAALLWWQFDNIKSVYYSFKYNNDQIDTLIDKHYDDIDNYLKEHSNYEVRQSTEVEQKLHQDEIITDKEFEDVLVGKNDVESMFGMDVGLNEAKEFVNPEGDKLSKEELIEAKKENSSDSSATTDKLSSQKADEKAAQSIAKMYVLKSTFESELDKLYGQALAYYDTMTPEQKKNAKSEVMKKFYSTAVSLEESCDAQVDAVLKELESVLKAEGESTELVTKIKTAYSEEKSLKKAYYLNLHK